jgi:RNA polymerase sigma-70 factor (ECF subfamily)
MSAPDAVLESLYQAHAPELQRFARRRIGPQDAEDIVQDAYLHLLQKEQFESLEHPRAFLFRIASNLSVDAIRKTRTRSRHAECEIALHSGVAYADNIEAAEDAIEMQRFHAYMEELPPACREAFLLNRIDGFTHSEIAKKLGVSIRTVDRHMVRALTHLQNRFRRKRRA